MQRAQHAVAVVVLLVAGCGSSDGPGAEEPTADASAGPLGTGGAGGCAGRACDAAAAGGATIADAGPDAAAPDGAAIDSAADMATAGSGPDAGAGGATGTGGSGGSAGTCGVCAAYGEPELLGRIDGPGLDALSGIAASWRNPGVVYVHNDRSALEFFAFGERANLLGRFTLTGPGASAHDIEDAEVARCPAGTCLYLADIGNNIAPLRSELAIFRVTEPAVSPTQAAGAPVALPFERFTFTYPDGATTHNAESLLIDPRTGTLYVIDKRAAGQASSVYKLPALQAGRAVMAVKVADLPVPAAGDQPATAGSAHPCGAGFLLRTNNTLFEFRIDPAADFESAFRVTPARVPAGVEAQGEAVAYAADGRGYYTTSERATPPLHRVRCR